MSTSSRKFSVIDLVVVGLMAAIIFVTTSFIKIQIPTPTGPTMLKVANIICLLSGMLFGGVRGGLAAGIGSFLFDLTNPAFVSGAPFTLINFFLMAFVCGVISTHGKHIGKEILFNIIGAVCGCATYFLLYIGKSVITLMLAGSAFSAAVIATAPKMITSSINSLIAIVGACLLAPLFAKALKSTRLYQNIFRRH